MIADPKIQHLTCMRLRMNYGIHKVAKQAAQSDYVRDSP